MKIIGVKFLVLSFFNNEIEYAGFFNFSGFYAYCKLIIIVYAGSVLGAKPVFR
jgi:hypothetical protein